MKRNILLLLLLLISCSVFASGQNFIVGRWKYHAVYDVQTKKHSNNTDEKMWYGTTTFYFKKNNHYKIYTGSSEEGTWRYDERSNVINLVSNDKVKRTLKVIKSTGDRLTVQVEQLGIGHTALELERAPAGNDEIEAEPTRQETINLTTAQIARKWIFKSCEENADSETALATGLNEASHRDFFDFKPNGRLEARLLTEKIRGSWKLGPDRQSIILIYDDENGGGEFEVIKITATELILRSKNLPGGNIIFKYTSGGR